MYEFSSTIENGCIAVPQEYLGKISSNAFVTVVMTVDNEEEFETYGDYAFEDFPKDTQEVILRSREWRAGRDPGGSFSFDTADEAIAFLNAED